MVYISGIHLFSSVHSHTASLSHCLPAPAAVRVVSVKPGLRDSLGPTVDPLTGNVSKWLQFSSTLCGVSPPFFPVVLQLTRAWRGRGPAGGEPEEQEGRYSGLEGLPATPQDWEGSLFPLFLINNSSPIKPWSLFSRLPFSGFTVTFKGIFIKFF